MNKLTIFWGNESDPSFYWVGSQEELQDNSQRPIHRLENHEILKADLSCLADMASSSQVSLVVSCQDVISARLTVPNKAQKLLRKAIPYMIEDDVASSVDDLFFAIDEKVIESKINVRAIERVYLEKIVQQFQDAEIKLSKITVDIDRVVAPEEGLLVIIDDRQCLVVDDKLQRWHCHSDDFAWLIQKMLNDIEVDEELPIAIPLNIIASQAIDEFIHQLPVGRFAVESTEETDIRSCFSSNAPVINILQAEYEPKKESSKLNGFFMKVASVAGIVLLTHLIFQGVNYYTLSETKMQLDKQKFTLFKQAFPTNKNVRSPEKEMRVYLKSLGGNSGGGGFLSLLNSSSDALIDLNKIQPTNISYDHTKNELKMDVIASDLTVLDQYAETLRKAGHQVDKSSETQKGDGYSSRLTISR